MCVIIFIPKGETITKEELKSAWTTNPDGAGYSIQTTDFKGNPVVLYHRGFMSFNALYSEIEHKIGKYNIMLHFRITTSNAVNQIQTHPYQKTDIKRLKGITSDPVIAMNGIISDQIEYSGLNDTMSYILDNQEVFKIITKHQSQELVDLLESATGCRWGIMTPTGILLSKGFILIDGKYYSNDNHLKFSKTFYSCSVYDYGTKTKTYNSLIKKSLRTQLNRKKHYELYNQVLDFIDFNCNHNQCYYCIKCLTDIKTLPELKLKLKEDMYY